MSIDANMAVLLRDCLRDAPAGKRSIITLGRQTIRIAPEHVPALVGAGVLPPAAGASLPQPLDQEWLFRALGFEEVHSLDVSDYEQCTHLFDLNQPELPPELVGRYQVVFNGGTLEHLFNAAQGLKNALGMLEPGGLFIHAGPVNNWEDHGFYQFSPGLLHDYFHANAFEACFSAALLDTVPPGPDGPELTVVPLLPGERSRTFAQGRRVAHLFSARRLAHSTLDQVPKQTVYVAKHDDGGTPPASYRTFPSFVLRAGMLSRLPVTQLELVPADVEAAGEGVFRVQLRLPAVPASVGWRPFRSPVVVWEDGEPLRVASSPQALRAAGPGHFCHWGGRLLFRTSDASDPRRNGRRYAATYPVLSSS